MPRLRYLGRIWRLRHFWMSLVRMDLRTRYRGSFLGLGWSLVRPAAMTAVFCIVFCSVFHVAAVDYVPYLLAGLTVWQFLQEAILHGAGSFAAGSLYIRQQPVPLAIFPLRTVLGAGFHAGVGLGLAVVAAWTLTGVGNFSALPALIPSLLLLFLLGWLLAILCGVCQVLFPDTQHILAILWQIVFYLTPVFYPPELFENHPQLALIMGFNPLTHLLELVRLPICQGTFPPLEAYAVALLLVCLVGLGAGWCLRRMEQTLVFWL